MSKAELIQSILDNTKPLAHPRGERLPLYLWGTIDIDLGSEAETEDLVLKLDKHGIAVVSTWGYRAFPGSLESALRVVRIQKKHGLRVNVNATPVLDRFCDGSEATAHVDADGEPFFDMSFSETVKMGCPFSLTHRYADIEGRLQGFIEAYIEEGLSVDFIFTDWEIDGAIEWNGAWDASKRCVRCRESVSSIDEFRVFQRAIRIRRSEMQRVPYADVLRRAFPDVLVGNYGVYPHNGYRYWYDYFEEFVEGAPHRLDGRAKYREWDHEFPETNFTFAMPVVYTWDPIYNWYDFDEGDYRWFYNILLVASNAGAHTSADVPIIPFVHWHTTWIRAEDSSVKQFSEERYIDLLWHMLLRGHDTFFLWCPSDQAGKESSLVHQVYAESLEYKDFLDGGVPVTFDVPSSPGSVVSGLRLPDRVLVRRTDFTDSNQPVSLDFDGRTIEVPRMKGRSRIFDLP